MQFFVNNILICCQLSIDLSCSNFIYIGVVIRQQARSPTAALPPPGDNVIAVFFC